ncbi:MAG: hypothetical protein AB1646_22655 [Thermodesulfobacteriota bacterium]
MNQAMSFGDVLEAVDSLTLEEQETLIDIVRRRMAEKGRQRVIREVREGRDEFSRGLCVPRSPEELMKEILS